MTATWINRVRTGVEFFIEDPGARSGVGGENTEAREVNIRWLWIPLVGASVFLALPGNETIGGVLGDVVGHFFSAAMVAVVPVVGYRLIFKDIGEKEITYIFAAAWAYLVISQIFKL